MKTVIVLLFLTLVGCQTQLKKDPSRQEGDRSTTVKTKEAATPTTATGTTPSQPQTEDREDGKPVVDDNATPDEIDPSVKPRPIPRLPKVGVIFGPGGGRVYGQIGVLQEFQKNKIPIYNTAGMEMGALVGSLYAWRGSANDAEWQMFKIKSDDLLKKNIISGKRTGEFEVIQNVIKSAFHNLKAEDLKKTFACPAVNLEKNKMFLMNKGSLEAMLPYCIPYPPLFKPHQKNLAGIREVKGLADYLRKQGANYIVFINVLGGNSFKTPIGDGESTDNLVWADAASLLVKDGSHVDYMITLNLDSFGILDFENKRDIMMRGSQQASRAVRELAEKLGL